MLRTELDLSRGLMTLLATSWVKVEKCHWTHSWCMPWCKFLQQQLWDQHRMGFERTPSTPCPSSPGVAQVLNSSPTSHAKTQQCLTCPVASAPCPPKPWREGQADVQGCEMDLSTAEAGSPWRPTTLPRLKETKSLEKLLAAEGWMVQSQPASTKTDDKGRAPTPSQQDGRTFGWT